MKKSSIFIPIDKNIGQRLDVFLHTHYPDRSRSSLVKEIREGAVKINHEKKKPSYILKKDDLLEVAFLEDVSPHTIKKNFTLKIPVLFENEFFIIINKPPGIQVHPSSTEKENTLVNWVAAQYPDILTVGEDLTRPGIVHRLDKDTSGILVITKTNDSFKKFKSLFASRNIQKEYLALVYGIPKETKGIIDQSIARSANFRKQTIPTGRAKWKGTPRQAITKYQIIKKFSSSLKATKFFSLLKFYPKTGRMHQIRIHASFIGHPVVGDKLYKRKEFKNDQSAPRQLLHAYKISFIFEKEKYSFTTPIPSDFETFLQNLKISS
ncbi:MAG: RluA family pseudouridine synthase [Candidatus Moraniibacteriota bacterium]|nr:MAG: RluA family pseudouridine synthase [Candidatus Moranbacteria bacterium]